MPKRTPPSSAHALQLSFAARVRRLREQRQLTQDEVAARCGLSVDSIRRMERAMISPTLRTLHCLCEAFELSPATLLGEFCSEREDLIAQIGDLLARGPADQASRGIRVIEALLTETSPEEVLAEAS